jgi:putative membrane protein insertion efficiency factor
MKHVFLLIIKFYQYFISPLVGRNCRFYPTCSSYAKEALTIHGTLKGLYLSIKRILKCNPFFEGGFDPVPTVKTSAKE